MYPLKFKPIFKHTLWGGKRIARCKNLPSQSSNIGESWEISGVNGSETEVANGILAGQTLSEVISQYKEHLVGRKVYETFGNTFPLLIKFIDATQDLSIQVHPDNEMAKRIHNKMGKSEMWYVIDSMNGGKILSGLTKQITPEEYKFRVKDNSICQVIASHEAHQGDVFFIPSGRVHSIGAGCFVAEIQQTSDITYRIYDFDRRDKDGNPRELHTELAAEAIDYNVENDYRTHYVHKKDARCLLADTPYFKTNLLDLTTPFEYSNPESDSFVILICIEGKCTIRIAGMTPTQLSSYETLLIPADIKNFTIAPEGNVQLLETHL